MGQRNEEDYSCSQKSCRTLKVNQRDMWPGLQWMRRSGNRLLFAFVLLKTQCTCTVCALHVTENLSTTGHKYHIWILKGMQRKIDAKSLNQVNNSTAFMTVIRNLNRYICMLFKLPCVQIKID